MEREDVEAFFRVLYTTRAVRRLRPDPVPEETLFQLIDAAIRAPSGQNAQDWRFIGYFCLGYPESEDTAPELERQGWSLPVYREAILADVSRTDF